MTLFRLKNNPPGLGKAQAAAAAIEQAGSQMHEVLAGHRRAKTQSLGGDAVPRSTEVRSRIAAKLRAAIGS
jgi:hypothetical protein